jgi:uncharacterized membrane protein
MSREFWIAVRRAVLLLLDALEKELGIEPTTATIRKRHRAEL